MNDTPTSARTSAKKAAKKPRKAPVDPGYVLKLRWDLHELPSSQHRAGLAGLALSVQFLQRKPDRKGVCKVENIDERGLTLAVDRPGMQSLFDDLYDASLEEQRQEKKQYKGKGAAKKEVAPKREEVVIQRDEKTGKEKPVVRYVYDYVVARGAMLEELDEGIDGKKPWLKLWRDVLWATTHNRGRGAYEHRAFGAPPDDGGLAWDALRAHPSRPVGLAGTFALGAEEANDDAVPLSDREACRFLLRFWRLIVPSYVLLVTSRKEPLGSISKPERYAIAIPDIADLESFTSRWPEILRQRSSQLFKFRPRDAVIDVAGEAGLDLWTRASGVLAAGQGSIADGLFRGVDVFSIEKGAQGSTVRSVLRVDATRKMVDEYARVRAANYWNPSFRHQRISNVLESRPWWWGFAKLCSTTPDEMTIRHQSFQHDCKAALTEIEMKQDVAENDQTLEHMIFHRVQAYVLGKTERKYGLSWSKVKDNPGLREDYSEKREKVSREAFLAVRSRTGADFVAYFTSTICSVPQHATEATFLEIARALMDPKGVERVRSLTLLALSAVA